MVEYQMRADKGKDKKKKKAQFFYPHVGAKESGSSTVTKKGIRNGQKHSQIAKIA